MFRAYHSSRVHPSVPAVSTVSRELASAPKARASPRESYQMVEGIFEFVRLCPGNLKEKSFRIFSCGHEGQGENRPCDTVDCRNLAGVKEYIRDPRERCPNVKRQHQGSLVASICRTNHIRGKGRVDGSGGEGEELSSLFTSNFTLAKLRLRRSDRQMR